MEKNEVSRERMGEDDGGEISRDTIIRFLTERVKRETSKRPCVRRRHGITL